ncbi:MAG: phospholipid carrier-dependent glycosyltransferase, partial [Caldilineae bacterium]
MKPETRNPKLETALVFLLALLPRAVSLQTFVTADEAKWVYRSAQFLGALLRGDLPATAVNLTPAVTTTWLGSIGLWAYHIRHRAALPPFEAWLASLPPFRVELPLLAAVRLPAALFAAAAIALLYLLARRLWGREIALCGALLLALDPHTVALSRIIGHDAPAALFVALALLAMLLAWRPAASAPARGWNLLSGVFAGLAFLSKSPALFLIPFAGLLALVSAGRRGWPARRWLVSLALWGATAYAVVVLVWPAAWVAPLRQPFAVVQNAFRSATRPVEPAALAPDAEDERAANLGVWYYAVNGAFKLSVPVSVGLALGAAAAFRRRRGWRGWLESDAFWLAAFVLLFAIFMTLGGKRSNRYILPAFPPLAFLAAMGWRRLEARFSNRRILPVAVTLLALATLLPYAPYYFPYTNPLLGGPLTAPRLIKIGWGEGMDRVGAWLNQQPDAAAAVAGADYASTLAPFFAGRVVSPDAANLDYVVSYIKQRQAGSPPPPVLRYYNAVAGPLAVIRLAGMEYARIYPGPAVRLAETSGPVYAFRPHAIFAPIGGDWTLDLLWPVSPPEEVSLGLEGANGAWQVASGGRIIYNGEGLAVTRHTLSLPAGLPPGDYTLRAGEQALGGVAVRYGKLPAGFRPAEADFGGEVRLLGFDAALDPQGGRLAVRLALQAAPRARHDYTVYVHLIDAAGNRLTGHDAPPSPP